MQDFIRQHANLFHTQLCEIDLFAQSNVTSGKGGPFAAKLVLFSKDTQGVCTPVAFLPTATNRVLETGVASYHAEAQALSASNIAILKSKIAAMAGDKHLTPIPVLFSSAQPCMACLTKMEICARHLVSLGMIGPKDFILIYGSCYEETERVAGFHDYAYALDFFNFKNTETATKYSLIKHTLLSLDQAPQAVQEMFANNALVEAILVHNGRLMGVGYDQRTDVELFRTAECVALRSASKAFKEQGNKTPWNLHGAQLYTLNPDIGPLSYTECQWASISEIVALTSDSFCYPHQKGLDCPCCQNHELFKNLSKGYNTPWSMLQVFRDGRFPNLGQKAWESHKDHIMYNGQEPETALSSQEKAIFDNLFIPFGI